MTTQRFGATGLTCGHCVQCQKGRDNLCENVQGLAGFHVDGYAQDFYNWPARLTIKVPKGVSPSDAADVS